MKRIGIYAGTFNPVHAGHITFALQAMQAANLDKIVFLPERRPRHKQNVEHFGHRVAMLTRALKPHPQFEVLEITDVNFTVEHTLPKLKLEFPDSELVFLFGSDVVSGLMQWPKATRLLKVSELVVGVREKDDMKDLQQQIQHWSYQPKAVTMFASYAPDISSGKVREALRRRAHAKGLLTSVQRYSDHHWLYVSLA